MFTAAKLELRELIELVRALERFDATLAANPSIVPTETAWAERRRKEQRMLALTDKYELA